MTNKRPSQFTRILGLALRMRMQERFLVSCVLRIQIALFSLNYLKFVTVIIADQQACFNSVALKA